MPLTADQQQLVTEHLGLVRTEAWNYFRRSPSAMDIDDCLSAGMWGLCQACEAYPAYCSRHGFDPAAAGRSFFRAYVARRIRGAILDDARARDHLSRNARRQVKALREAEDSGIRDAAGQAAAAGLSVRQARRVQAAAQMSLSLEQYEAVAGDTSASLADDSPGTEAQAEVREVLAAVVRCIDRLPVIQQVVVALHFHQEIPLDVVAEELRIDEKAARKLHDEAVTVIHRAMLRAL